MRFVGGGIGHKATDFHEDEEDLSLPSIQDDAQAEQDADDGEVDDDSVCGETGETDSAEENDYGYMEDLDSEDGDRDSEGEEDGDSGKDGDDGEDEDELEED